MNRWQRKPATQLFCALAGLAPVTLLAAWVHVLRETPLTAQEMLLWPLLGGGGQIFWLLFLHLIICGDRLDDFGFRKPRPCLDLGLGAGLAAGMLAFHFAFNASVARLFPPRPATPEILDLLRSLADDPWLLALWLGPVVWIGVALFEELLRVFLLCRGWRVWGGTVARWAVIVAVSTLVGLGHGYQGPAAVLSIGLQSVAKGWIFMVTGRIRILIVAHALYDSIQIVALVAMLRGN